MFGLLTTESATCAKINDKSLLMRTLTVLQAYNVVKGDYYIISYMILIELQRL